MRIKINDRVNFTKCQSDVQRCIHCGELMTRIIGINMTNKGDDLSLKKNLWLHIHCMNDFIKIVRKSYNKNKKKIFAESI